MMHGSVCVCVCLGTLLAVVSAYPGQVAETACKDMTPKGPGHNGAKPQRTPLPKEYTVSPANAKIRSGDSVDITMKATGTAKFAGFMMQCRAGKSDKPVGTFTAKTDNAKTIACSSENDTGSHNDPSPKDMVIMTWNAPIDFKGNCTLRGTIAKTKTEFWAKKGLATMYVF